MPIKMEARARINPRKVIDAARQATFRSLGHAGAAIRKEAARSIKKAPLRAVRGADGSIVKDALGESVKRAVPSSPGSPPHWSRRGANLKRSILYAVERRQERVLIGPSHAMVGAAGAAHEHGGRYGDETYPRRPFMGPALNRVEPRIPAMWRGVVKG